MALALEEPTGRGEEALPASEDDGGPDPAEAVAGLARALGHEARVVRVGYPTLERLDALAVDVVVDLTDGIGRDGEPGVEVAEALRRRGVRVTGAPALARLLADDKGRLRARLAARGVATPAGVLVPDLEAAARLARTAPGPGPWVVKPREGGAGAGVEVVVEPAALPARAAALVAVYGALLVEAFVDGPELSVTLLGDRALPAVEVAFDDDVPAAERVLSFVAKHDPERGPEWGLLWPPRVPADEVARAEATALAAWRAVGGDALGRVDLRRGPDGWLVLDVNPAPAFQPTVLRADRGLVATALRAAGLSYLDLVRSLIAGAR